jgi:hypothetical protein
MIRWKGRSVAKQLGLAFGAGGLQPIDWKALDRRARRTALAIAAQCSSGVREGFAIRRYAEDVTLLGELRRISRGKYLKRAVRNTGRRLSIPSAALVAMMPGGGRLNRFISRVEARVLSREASILCG